MRRDGRIEFWGSNTFREQTRSWVNQRTYSSKSSQLRYSALDFAERRDRTRNQAHVTRAHSTLGFLLKSTTYQNLYGVRSTAFDGVRAASDADARALPDQPIWRRRELPYNVDSVSVQPGRNPSVAWPLLLAQDIMDRVTVKWRTAVNRATNLSGSTYTLSGLVTGWHLSLDWPSQQATYQTLLECAPQLFSSTGSSSWLQVGTAGTNKLGY
jgi:hypothetical protein